MFARILVLFCTVYVCTAHLCTLSPPQRSPLKDLNKPGSDSCILLKGPCGRKKPNTAMPSLVGGSNFTVIFQKNLDHWNSADPGYFSVAISEDGGKSFPEVYRVADSNTPPLTLYTATITIPNFSGRKPVPLIIQSHYKTNNPQAPADFYQCSDVLVRPME